MITKQQINKLKDYLIELGNRKVQISKYYDLGYILLMVLIEYILLVRLKGIGDLLIVNVLFVIGYFISYRNGFTKCYDLFNHEVKPLRKSTNTIKNNKQIIQTLEK
jgi:hypothetical protein